MLCGYQSIDEGTQDLLIRLRQCFGGLVRKCRQSSKDILEDRKIVSADQAEALKKITVWADPFKHLDHRLRHLGPERQEIVEQSHLPQKIRNQGIRGQLLGRKVGAQGVPEQDILSH